MVHNIISYWPLWLFCILPSVYGFLHRVLLHIRSLYLVFIIVSSFVVELPLLTKRNELSQCQSSAAQPAGITPQSRHLCWLPSSLEDGPGFCSFGCSCVAPTPTLVKLFENSGTGCTRSAAGSRLGVPELPKCVCLPGAADLYQWTVRGFLFYWNLELFIRRQRCTLLYNLLVLPSVNFF